MHELKFIFLVSILYPTVYQPNSADLGNFVHYMIVDILTWRHKSSLGIAQKVFSLATELMTPDGYELDYFTMATLFSLNDYSSYSMVSSYKSSILKKEYFSCMHHINENKTKNQISFDHMFQDIQIHIKPSPCIMSDISQDCKSFCRKMLRLGTNSLKEELLTFMRYVIPQQRVQLKPMPESEQRIAERLFGKENLKQNITNHKSPAPFILFCKNRRDQEFSGLSVNGMSARFCDSFYPSQTDVGICMTQNLNLGNLIDLHKSYDNFMESELQDGSSQMDGENAMAENIFVLQSDILSKESYLV